MSFTHISIKDLEQFSLSLAHLHGQNIAITPWRAKSQAKNPSAKPDDTVLIYATDEHGNICGYIGALPARIQGCYKTRFAWSSCWWVKENVGAAISIGLLNEILIAWDYKIMFSDMNESNTPVISRFCPSEIKKRPGFLIWLRADLCRKTAGYRHKNRIVLFFLKTLAYTRIVHLADLFINAILFPLQLLKARQLKTPGITMSESEELTVEDVNFINEHKENDVFYPDTKWYNWVLDNPWLVKKTKTNKDIASKYYFSSFADENNLKWLRIRKNGKLSGLFLLSVRNRTVKTQFAYVDKSNEYLILKNLFSHFLNKYKYKNLISFHPLIVAFLRQKKLPFLLYRRKERYCAVSNALLNKTGKDFTMQDGMGDYVFT